MEIPITIKVNEKDLAQVFLEHLKNKDAEGKLISEDFHKLIKEYINDRLRGWTTKRIIELIRDAEKWEKHNCKNKNG